MPIKLGELRVKENLITPQQLQEALQYQKQNGGKLGYNLVKLGFVKDEEITQLLSRQYGVPSINLARFEIDPSVIKLVPAETAQKYQIIPLSRAGANLTIAMVDPTNVFTMDDIKFMTGYNVEPVVASETAIMESIEKYYGSVHSLQIKEEMDKLVETDEFNDDVEVLEEGDEIDLAELEKSSEEAPVVKLCNLILTDALRRGASDIHIEPYEREFRVRFRIDGVLYVVMNPPMKLRDAMISRIKIMAKLDISEKRLPQDGRIKLRMNNQGKMRELDYRVSTLPTLFGEKIVLRLLDKENLMLDMTKLGFEVELAQEVRGSDLQAVGHGARDGSYGQRQDQHALLRDQPAQYHRDQHHDRRGPGGVQPGWRQSSTNEGVDRTQLRRGAPLIPATGSEHRTRR